MAKARKFGHSTDGMQEAKGLIAFHCPGCNDLHVIPTIQPLKNGAIWQFNGNLERPTFSPSILIRTGKYVPGHADFDDEGLGLSTICHSFVTEGKIQFCGDCTHSLVNQTVDLPDIEE